MEKAYISLISVCVGWTLSQLTDYVKNAAQKNKIENAVKSEIKDMTTIIFDARNIALRSAKRYGKNADYSYNLSAHINLPIIEKYYTEIFSLFSENQRQNYRMLLKHLGFYNKIVDFFESGSRTTHTMARYKLTLAYQHLAFSFVFITALSGDDIIDDHHPKIVKLREHFKKQFSSS